MIGANASRAGFERGNTVGAADLLRFGSKCSTSEPGRASSFLKLFASFVVYWYRPKAHELNLNDYASSVFSLFVIQSLTGGAGYALVVR